MDEGKKPWERGRFREKEAQDLTFPPDNHEEIMEDIAPSLQAHPEVAKVIGVDPTQMLEYLAKSKELKTIEIEHEKAYKLAHDNRMRTDAFLWKDMLQLYEGIKGLKGRPELKEEFKPFFEFFSKRSAKAAATLREKEQEAKKETETKEES